VWTWLAQQDLRLLDIVILAAIAFNHWKIHFLVKWLTGGNPHGTKKEKSEG